MTQDIALCLLILAFSVNMFATEILRMDLVALLVASESKRPDYGYDHPQY